MGVMQVFKSGIRVGKFFWDKSGEPLRVLVQTRLADISTASSAYAVAPVAGKIVKITSVIDGAITLVDAILSHTIGGVAITGGNITIAFTGSAAGDVDSSTPTAANTVAADDYLSTTTNGASTGTVAAVVTFEIDPSQG